MLKISTELKDRFIEMNDMLRDSYHEIFNIDNNRLRNFIQNNVGTIKTISKIEKKELENFMHKGGLIGVDGSRNRLGGVYPHFIEVFQGLAKNSIHSINPIYAADFYTPLCIDREMEILDKLDKDNPTKEEKDSFISNYKLSGIEVEVAIEGVKKLKPYAIMMDGSLIRYKIECEDKWKELREECEKNGVILLGVIKDIKTNVISDALIENGIIKLPRGYIFDREILYGALNIGEMISIKKTKTGKFDEGLISSFLRTSRDPSVIAIDMLDSQEKHMENMARLTYTLTPEGSRGVPFWLDIIDSEVKISNKMLNGLVERYIDKEIVEKLFKSERSKRTMR